MQVALVRCGFALADIRKLTLPEVETYLSIINGRESGSARPGTTKRYIPARRKFQK